MFEEDFEKLSKFLSKNTCYGTISPDNVIYSIPDTMQTTKLFEKQKKTKATIYFTFDLGMVVGFRNLINPGSLCEYKIDNKSYYGGCFMQAIDIFIYSKNPNTGFYMLNDPENGIYESRKHYNPGAYFGSGELFPLVNYSLGPLQVLGPQNPIPYLERSYGEVGNMDAWKTPKSYYDEKHQLVDEIEIMSVPKQKSVMHLTKKDFTVPPPHIVIFPFEKEKMQIQYFHAKANALFFLSQYNEFKQTTYALPISRFQKLENARMNIKTILERGFDIRDNKIIIKPGAPLSSRQKNGQQVIHHIPGKGIPKI